MAKKKSESLARAGRAGRSVRPLAGSAIDFSDIPESTEAELTRARRVGRPRSGDAKQVIAIRIHPGVLAALRKMPRKQDKPYQTLIHEILERATRAVA